MSPTEKKPGQFVDLAAEETHGSSESSESLPRDKRILFEIRRNESEALQAAIKRALDGDPSLSEALASIAIWECDRAVKQTHEKPGADADAAVEALREAQAELDRRIP